MNDLMFERFTDSEYARRWAGLDSILAAHDVDAVAVYGTDSARGTVQYLSAFWPRREAYLCYSTGSDPALFVQLFNHVPTAADMANIERVEWAGPNSAETAARDLADRAGEGGRIGVIGPIPYRQMDHLRSTLDGHDVVDLSAAFTALRLVKSDEELDWTRRGAALTDRAMLALAAASVPGANEHDLGAAFEATVRNGGGHPGICFLMSTPMGRPGRYVPAQHWSDRVLRGGDAVVVEMSAGYGGYTGQALRTITVEAEPPPAFRELHEVADAAFDAITDAIVPGASASDLLAAAAVIDDSGHTVCDDVVHGYGGGYLPPVLRTPATQHQPLRDLELLPGMFLVVQPNVINQEGTMGVQTGHLVVVTTDGHRAMHDLPRSFLAGGA
ncbi:MAG: M24 family metallopeptidase [Gemmatimonadota bacterium]|nr:M24 family metallopeptidase [Gemmatimonadota bacterium]